MAVTTAKSISKACHHIFKLKNNKYMNNFKVLPIYLTCTLLVVGSSVANNRSSARTLAPVNRFKSVLFPAFVYPT